MFKKIKDFFRKAWDWIEALWDKHDEMLEEMVKSVLPMVINVAFRSDLSGEEKKNAIVDAIVDNAEVAAETISKSVLNEAIEVAAARYNIQIGQLTAEKMDAALEAALKASRDFANKKLTITGQEAEEAGIKPVVVLDNEDVV
jgi:hypothetical protein